MTIDWANFTPWSSLAGGLLIGSAVAMFLFFNGRIAGILGGLLAGNRTRYGSGCTSRHGVCGLSQLSPRSLAAVAAFMFAGFSTVFAVRHLIA